MGVQLIYHQYDFIRSPIAPVQQGSHNLGKVLTGPFRGDLNVTPPGQRLEGQEHTRYPVPHVDTVVTCRPPRLCWQRFSDLANQLDEGLVQTDDRPFVLVRLLAGRRGVRGAPDFVVEVLSSSTASHDHVLKRRVYERAGVREYWLVHPIDRMVTIYRLLDGEYGKPDVQELSGETAVGVLEGVSVAWDDLVRRLPPPEF